MEIGLIVEGTGVAKIVWGMEFRGEADSRAVGECWRVLWRDGE